MSLIPHIEVLSLAGNFIGYTQEYDISRSSSPQPLYSRRDSSALAVKLFDTLKTLNTVKLLDFSDTNSGEPECEALAQWLSSPTCSLRVLNIGGNGLSFQATQVLITSLCHNCTLNELDISGSIISLKLLSSLIKLPLMRLNLNSCDLGPEEMCAIARALCGNSKLGKFTLDYNPIRDEGAIVLARGGRTRFPNYVDVM